jgi:Tol biopolymer transport system component
MTRQRYGGEAFDELVTSWLDDRAHGPAADEVLDRALARTARMRPLKRWQMPERWLPGGVLARFQGAPRAAAVLLIVGLLVVVALMAIAVASPRRLPPPFGLAAPGDVAFVADGHIWTANPDGSRRIQVTFDERIDLTPTFSRDGTKVAFKRLPAPNSVSNWQEWGDVIVADADGRHAVVIDRMIEAPSPITWSADGRFIVYSKIVGQVDQVVVAATDGSSTRVITAGPEANWGPALNPDGHTIAFVKGFPLVLDIYAIDVDGTNERPLTSIPIGDQNGLEWSPDGGTLVFSAGDSDVAGEDLWAVGLDGRPEHRIVDDFGSDIWPTWSPDGSLIAYLNWSPAGIRVMVANSDGSDSHPITAFGDWFNPQWSPDARHVLAVDGRRGDGQPIVAILDPSGHDPPSSFTLPDASGVGRADQSSWQRLAP